MKVLQFFGEPLSYGGQEAFILNMYNNFNNSKIHYTFVTPFFANNNDLINIIKMKNDNIIVMNRDFYSKKRKKYILETIKSVLKNEKFDVIHIHSGSIFTLYYVSKVAKKNGIKKVIVHSHATGYDNLKHKVIKCICNMTFTKYADYFFACSLEAGKFKFSNKIINSSRFKVINNGIDLNTFKFNVDIRNKIREKYNIKDKNVICNVGRYSEEKNHLFLLKIFKEYLNIDNNGYLILIGGSGPMEYEIKKYIKNNNLDNYILLLKERKDVSDFLNASDIFVFPSKFEGLGISVIEAQATGLYTICSDNIPNETKVTNNYMQLSLNKDAKEWAKIIYSNIDYKRMDTTNYIKKNGFDIKECAVKLEEYYVGDVNE